MAYNKTDWIDNSLPPIDEINLNKIESGISDAHAGVTSHSSNTNNPHVVTQTQVGLSNVDNTSDVNKPVSIATQTALDLKSDKTHTHNGVNGEKVDHINLNSIGINTHSEIDLHITKALVDSDALTLVDETNKLLTEHEEIILNNKIDALDTVVDDHIADVDNPHAVTYSDIGGVQPAPVAHTHVESEVTDLDKYTQLEVDNKDTVVQNSINSHVTDMANPHGVGYDDIEGTQPQPMAHTHVEDDITDLVHYTNVDADARIQLAIRDDDPTLTTLYSGTKIQALIEGSLVYQGLWDASTNIPSISDATGVNGYYYEVSVDGTQDLGSGSIDFIVGDRVTHNGTIWEKSSVSTVASWGNITGTLSDQLDLQTELDGKSNTDHLHDGVYEPANANIQEHIVDVTNPHSVTKAQVGLPNVPDSIAQDLADHETDFANPHLTTISNLGDTSVVDASEGQRLSYNETTGLWEPRNSVSGLGFVVFDYNFDTDITNTPASGNIQMNNVDATLATELYFHSIDRTGKDVDAYWNEIKEGDWFNIYRSNDTTRFYSFDATGPAIQNGSVWTIPVVSYLVEGTPIGDGNRVKVLWRISQTQVIDNLVTPRSDFSLSANMGVVLKADVDTKVEWQGEWVNATYYLNDMVRDGVYTSICNVVSTTDRPAPQDIGSPYNIYTGILSPYQQMAKQVMFGQRYTLSSYIQIDGYRVDVIAGNHYEVFLVQDPEGDAIFSSLSSFTSTTTGWLDIASGGSIIGAGVVFDIVCIANEPAAVPTVTPLNYDYVTPNNVTIPTTGQITHADKSTGVLYVHKTDNDGNDNSTFLDTLTVGDIIELDTMRWSIQNILDNATYKTIDVSPATQSGLTGVQVFNFETIVATPITVGYELDANIANSISGLYIVDGIYGDISPDDNQYGIDVLVQDVSISTDWDIVAMSGGSSSGGDDGGTAIEIVDNLVTQDAAKALSANQGYVLDNAKVANERVLTDVPGGAVFTDTIYNDSVIQGEVDLNTAKETNVDHPLVETAVPLGALFTDTPYDDTSVTEHIADMDNPHAVDKVDVGLGNVDNTTDLNKPISMATQTALDGKLGNVVEDTTPELGGDLNALNKKVDNTRVIMFNDLYDNGTKVANWDLDANVGQYQKVTIDGDCIVSFIGFYEPCTIYLHVHQGATGGVLTLPEGDWVDSTQIGFSVGSGKHDLLMIHYYGSVVYGMMSNLG